MNTSRPSEKASSCCCLCLMVFLSFSLLDSNSVSDSPNRPVESHHLCGEGRSACGEEMEAGSETSRNKRTIMRVQADVMLSSNAQKGCLFRYLIAVKASSSSSGFPFSLLLTTFPPSQPCLLGLSFRIYDRPLMCTQDRWGTERWVLLPWQQMEQEDRLRYCFFCCHLIG